MSTSNGKGPKPSMEALQSEIKQIAGEGMARPEIIGKWGVIITTIDEPVETFTMVIPRAKGVLETKNQVVKFVGMAIAALKQRVRKVNLVGENGYFLPDDAVYPTMSPTAG